MRGLSCDKGALSVNARRNLALKKTVVFILAQRPIRIQVHVRHAIRCYLEAIP